MPRLIGRGSRKEINRALRGIPLWMERIMNPRKIRTMNNQRVRGKSGAYVVMETRERVGRYTES